MLNEGVWMHPSEVILAFCNEVTLVQDSVYLRQYNTSAINGYSS